MWWPNVVTVVIVNYNSQDVCDDSHCVLNCQQETSSNYLTKRFDFILKLFCAFILWVCDGHLNISEE
jgi:hypothetical protein